MNRLLPILLLVYAPMFLLYAVAQIAYCIFRGLDTPEGYIFIGSVLCGTLVAFGTNVIVGLAFALLVAMQLYRRYI